MTREEYLRILQSNLVNVPPEEVWNIMQYYREYFDDAGEENFQRVIDELGPPELLAKKVSADFVMGEQRYKMPEKKNYTGLIILLVVLCSPLWFSALIVVVSLIFSAVVVVASIIFAFGAAGISITGGGICTLGAGIAALFTHIPTGIMLIGAGLLCMGVGLLFIVLLCWIINGVKIFAVWTKSKISQRKNKKTINL